MKTLTRNALLKGAALGLVLALMSVATASAAAPATVNYGSFTLSPGYTATNWSDIWDLTRGDLILSYTIDMTGVHQPAPWATSYSEVGIRQVGAGNFNPGPWNTYQGGAGGWMTSLVGDLTSNPSGQNLNDKHNLGASGGRGELDYDATDPNTVVDPFGTGINYGMWFDRDGVDQWQAAYWGAVNGGTYNTGGIYNVVITYHAVSPSLGTMFATVNGIKTGFYTGAWFDGQPDIYPAGLSFKGDMTKMQVFAGLWAPDASYGDVNLSDIEVTGLFAPFTVAALVSGGHGSVSPATQMVNYGDSASINITPDPGYHIATITDNGNPATIANPYVISKVAANHSVVVTFAPTQPATKDQCNDDGWQNVRRADGSTFKNQGDCIQYVNTGK